MELLQAVVLGIVQAITEFLPISSSGHLILVPWLLGWDAPLLNSLAFDAALHLGTGLALVVFFWRDLAGYVTAVRRGLTDPAARCTSAWRLAWMVAVGTVPGAILGLAAEKTIEELFRSPARVASLLVVFSLLLYAADRFGRKVRPLDALGWRDAIIVGIAQALALMPGVSRSGVTMSVALALGLTREAAARFSFLLATPVTVGAGLYKLVKAVRDGDLSADQAPLFAAGILTAGLVGWVVIRAFLAYVRGRSLAPFVAYRMLAGLGVLALVALRVRPA